jgi:hypothetical protein
MLKFTNVDDIGVVRCDYFASCVNLDFVLNIYNREKWQFWCNWKSFYVAWSQTVSLHTQINIPGSMVTIEERKSDITRSLQKWKNSNRI